MAFAITGFQTVAQNFISRQIASNFYKKCPLLSLLGALTIGNNKKDTLEIGRPDSGEILTGGIVSPIQKKRLGSVNAYLPRIQGFETNNSRYRSASADTGGRDTLPDVAAKSTQSHGQAMQFAAEYRWCHMDTPILIWHEDKIRAGREGTAEGQAIAMGQLVDEATEVGMQDMLTHLSVDTWDGNPTAAEQNYALWPKPLGLLKLVDDSTGDTARFADATVARVDRNSEPLWCAQVDATLTAVDVRKIIDDAKFHAVSGTFSSTAGTRAGLSVIGGDPDLMLVPLALYPTFKAQVLANGGTVLLNGLPAMAKMGVKKEILQIDNTLIMYDPQLTDGNTVLVGDTSVLKWMVHPQYNFKVGEFVDNTKTGIAKETYDYAYVTLRYIFALDNPRLWVKYVAIGT